VSCFLLDVNVLVALIDPAHVHHDRAHHWFGATGKRAWATCPLSENGVLRVVGHKRYPNTPGPPAAVAELLAGFRALPGHEFWPDDATLFNDQLVDRARLLDSGQVTDTYLLALASAHSGKLATFDRHLVAGAVVNGKNAVHPII
jgi:uncharacterized protein